MRLNQTKRVCTSKETDNMVTQKIEKKFANRTFSKFITTMYKEFKQCNNKAKQQLH